jgi:hypothetical protein
MGWLTNGELLREWELADPALVLFRPPQIPHYLIWDRTRTIVVGSRRLSYGTVRRFFSLSIQIIVGVDTGSLKNTGKGCVVSTPYYVGEFSGQILAENGPFFLRCFLISSIISSQMPLEDCLSYNTPRPFQPRTLQLIFRSRLYLIYAAEEASLNETNKWILLKHCPELCNAWDVRSGFASLLSPPGLSFCISLQENAGKSPKIKPQALPSMSFPIHYSPIISRFVSV